MDPVNEILPDSLPQTEFEFTLPRGYLDSTQSLQRRGVMRLATARDEILALGDPAVKANPAYLPVVRELVGVTLDQGDLAGAAQWLRRVVELDPADTDARRVLRQIENE